MQKAATEDDSPNNYIIQSGTGEGKTTLLRLIVQSIQGDENLSSYYHVIELPTIFYGGGISDTIEHRLNSLDISVQHKHLLLFIDDIYLSLERSERDCNRLRSYLLNENYRISFIAAGSVQLKHTTGYNEPLFGSASIRKLKTLDDSDAEEFLQNLIQVDYRDIPIVRKIEEVCPFWVYNLTGNNPRRLKALSLLLNLTDSDSTVEYLLFEYFSLISVFIRTEYLNLPENNRLLAETAIYYPNTFRLRDLDLSLGNPSREAKGLCDKGILEKIEPGIYRFNSIVLKTWLRYAKKLPVHFVLSPDSMVRIF